MSSKIVIMLVIILYEDNIFKDFKKLDVTLPLIVLKTKKIPMLTCESQQYGGDTIFPNTWKWHLIMAKYGDRLTDVGTLELFQRMLCFHL